MTMQPVESTNVKAIGYDPVSGIMRVEFKSGGSYDYPGTVPEEHAAFMASDSKGKYFHRHIRGREHVKVA